CRADGRRFAIVALARDRSGSDRWLARQRRRRAAWSCPVRRLARVPPPVRAGGDLRVGTGGGRVAGARRFHDPVIMNAFLASIGYDRWILPALLAIPIAGAVLIWLQGATGGRTGGAPAAAPEESAAARAGADPRTSVDEIATGVAGPARTIALLTFLIEFIVSLGLWWAFDPADAQWQF